MPAIVQGHLLIAPGAAQAGDTTHKDVPLMCRSRREPRHSQTLSDLLQAIGDILRFSLQLSSHHQGDYGAKSEIHSGAETTPVLQEHKSRSSLTTLPALSMKSL